MIEPLFERAIEILVVAHDLSTPQKWKSLHTRMTYSANTNEQIKNVTALIASPSDDR